MKIPTQVLDSTYGQSAVGIRARLERSERRRLDHGLRRCDQRRGVHRGLERRLAFRTRGSIASFSTAIATLPAWPASTAYPEMVVTFRMPDESRTFQIRGSCCPRIRTRPSSEPRTSGQGSLDKRSRCAGPVVSRACRQMPQTRERLPGWVIAPRARLVLRRTVGRTSSGRVRSPGVP